MSTYDAIDWDVMGRFERLRAPRGLGQTFRALRHPDFRMLWLEHVLSSTGQSMRVMVRGMLVYQMTSSAFSLGWVTTVVGIPQLVMPFLGGVLADRLDRRKMLVSVQWMLTTLWFSVALLILAGEIQIWHIVLSGIISGLLQAFSRPASMAMLPNLVPREDLTNAVALFSSVMSVAGIVGPSVGGALVVWIGGDNERFGIGGVFLITAMAILVASVMVLLIRWQHQPTAASRASILNNLMEGLRFVAGDSAIAGLILLGFAGALLVQPVTFFMPIFATDVLKVGSSGLGLLLTARGIGALVGALSVASMATVRQKGRILLVCVVVYAVVLVLFTQSRWFPASLVLLGFAGATQTVVMTMSQTLLQLATPDEIRGRVMSTRMMTMGFLSVGSLWMGGLSELTSTPFAVAFGATMYGVFTVALFGLVPRLRRSHEWDPSLDITSPVPAH